MFKLQGSMIRKLQNTPSKTLNIHFKELLPIFSIFFFLGTKVVYRTDCTPLDYFTRYTGNHPLTQVPGDYVHQHLDRWGKIMQCLPHHYRGFEPLFLMIFFFEKGLVSHDFPPTFSIIKSYHQVSNVPSALGCNYILITLHSRQKCIKATS